MARYQLTEAQLRGMIQEAVEEAMNENWFTSGAKAIGGAFKNDAGRLTQGAKNFGKRVSNTMQKAGQAVSQYAKDKGASIKGQYQANRNMEKIQSLLNDINELQQSGVLHGQQMNNAIAVIKKQLSGAIGREKGAVTSWQNS